MARKGIAIRNKTARDRKIDAAIDLASQQSGLLSKTTILIWGEDAITALSVKKGGAATATREKSPKPKQGKTINPRTPPTALELELTKIGLVKSRQQIASEKAIQVAKPVSEKVADIKPASPARSSQAVVALPTAKKQKPKKTVAKKHRLTKASAVQKVKVKSSRNGIRARASILVMVSDPDGKAERMMERQRSAARFIAGIDQKSFDELLNSWRENIVRLAPGNQTNAFRALASDLTEAIEGEWKRRAILARLDPEHFKWPSTASSPGNGEYSISEFSEGVLGYLGYHVGKSGEANVAHRQIKLARIFEGYLPPINGPDYMRQWGEPGQPVRLRKMAESIAYVIRTKRHMSADYSVAIEHWEEDLQYLYEQYYVERFGFGWPRTV